MARGAIIRRGLPILVGLAGLSLLVYGAAFSRHTVTFEEEVTPPAPPPPPPTFMPPGPGGRPQQMFRPPPQPPAKAIKVLRTAIEGESKLVLEATRGGVMLTQDGRLKRTYSGAPPSGCPT